VPKSKLISAEPTKGAASQEELIKLHEKIEDLKLVRKATVEYLFAQEFVLSYLLLLQDNSFGSIFSLLDQLKKVTSKKIKMDDRLPRSAYFYLNNTIDLREGKEEEKAETSTSELKK